jgi:hypothetical protein
VPYLHGVVVEGVLEGCPSIRPPPTRELEGLKHGKPLQENALEALAPLAQLVEQLTLNQ